MKTLSENIPLISVVVPVYNVEKYLDSCILSVISQSYQNFELLLIDDGSKDNSWQICKKYAEEDRRIKIFKQTNSGVTQARKKGWKESSGSWIVFLDSDDTITSDCLESLLYQALENGCDIVKGCMVNSHNGRMWVHKKLGLMDRKEYMQSIMLDETFAYLCASIYRSEIFQESTFQFDSSILIGEDVMTCIELGVRAQKILITDKVIYVYQFNPTSSTNSKVMHPSYVKKCYDFANKFFNQIAVVDKDVLKKRESILYANLLHAFFSPYIPFDSKFYPTIQVAHIYLDCRKSMRDRIFVLAARNVISARLTKLLFNLLYFGKHLLTFRGIQKREILY